MAHRLHRMGRPWLSHTNPYPPMINKVCLWRIHGILGNVIEETDRNACRGPPQYPSGTLTTIQYPLGNPQYPSGIYASAEDPSVPLRNPRTPPEHSQNTPGTFPEHPQSASRTAPAQPQNNPRTRPGDPPGDPQQILNVSGNILLPSFSFLL